MDENTTVEANIASLQMKAECSTLSWRTEVMQFMSITEYGINELGEKYDSLQKEYDILRQDITAEISQLSSNNDGIWIERLQTLEKDMVQTLAGVEERYSQKVKLYKLH
uniref:Uncharacterized protein n=1 Tax=Plectus sambesii TaxID=2011161 RepID=A0A914XBS2_9BILA